MANLVFDFLHHYQTGERRASDPADAYQYDEGHVMEAVVPVAVTSCEIHYWVRGQEEAEAYVPESITQNEDGSYSIIGHIPNTYFETYGELRVYIVVTDGTASITTYEGRIHICERSKPDDYVDDDPDNEATRVLTEAREAAATATAAAETCEEVLESIPEDYSTLSDDVSDLKDGLSDVEAQVTAALVTDTASGSIASFPDGADGVPVKSLTVDIEPVQSGSGDPSPTNIRPISGHTSAVVTRTGKNVITGTVNGRISPTANGTAIWTFNNDVISVIFPCVAGQTYTVNVLGQQGSGRWGVYDHTPAWDDVALDFGVNTSATITPNKSGLCYFYVGSASTDVSHAQVEIGTTSTAYESPNIQTYTIDLDGTRYGGTLDVGTGVLTVDRQIVDLGTLTWNYDSGLSRYESSVISDMKPSAARTGYILSDRYQSITDGRPSGNVTNNSIYTVIEKKIFVVDNAYSSASSFKTAVTGSLAIYPLVEPLTIQLTANEITTLLGQNNIWNDCGNTEVEYRADTKLYIQKVLNA